MQQYHQLPKKQGLYDPQFERDACGIGFVVNIKGKKSHEIVEQALTILMNLTHRGGSGSEANTGDGAGLLIQIPHTFFKKACDEIGINLPSFGKYGAGMVFLPQDEAHYLDMLALAQITDINPDGLIRTIQQYNISMCGVVPVSMALSAMRKRGGVTAKLLHYHTSGDVTSDRQEVVGYGAVAFYPSS
jgi:glutamate synthase domain-containing protein 1